MFVHVARAPPEKVISNNAGACMRIASTDLDVRTAEEFEAGHVPGAINIPVMLKGDAGMPCQADIGHSMAASMSSGCADRRGFKRLWPIFQLPAPSAVASHRGLGSAFSMSTTCCRHVTKP